jgi:hypothetical protein
MVKKIKINPAINLNEGQNNSDVQPHVKGESINEGVITRSSLHPQVPQVDLFTEALKLNNRYNSATHKDLNILQAYTQIYSKATGSMYKIIQEVDQIRSFYLVDVILGQLTEDALTPEIGTDEILKIKYPKDKGIEEKLQKLEKDLNLDQLLLDITPDLLAYGEYVLRVDYGKILEMKDELGTKNKTYKKQEGNGVIALRDIVEQGKVVSLTQEAENKGYLYMDEEGKIIKTPASTFIKFTLNGQRVRVRIEDQAPFTKSKSDKVRSILATLPRYVRIGKSQIHPFISKFKELELLEKLIPATKISKLSNVNLVGMQVPGKYNIEQGLEAAKRVEGIINNKVGIDKKLGEITVESVLSIAGRSKVVPLFGDKGALDKMDFKSDEPDDLLGSANDVRALILDSVGIPFELLYKSDGESKGELLKRYARYLRKLKNIQRSLIDGVKQLCAFHMESLDIDKYDEDDLEVEFLNKLIEIDNLDKLEHADVTVSLLGNVKDFFGTLTEEDSPFKEAVDLNEVADYINRNLRTIGLADALLSKNEGGPDIKLETPEDDGADSDAFGDSDTGGDDDGTDADGKDDGPDSGVF